MTYELLRALGAFEVEEARLVEPRPAEKADLLLVHSEEYVEAVRRISSGESEVHAAAYNITLWGDNPPFPGMYEASLWPAGASLAAAEMVSRGEADVAFNIAGGLHHAGRGFASGFCIFNDPAIAIAHLMKKGLRVAYIDIDAHHGDGVQNAFYESDRVLTISLHESGDFLFPGTGFVQELGSGPGLGYSVNVPLGLYTDDETYLWAFEEVVPPLVEAFQPDIVVSQLGVDTHFKDPLTHLALTVQGYAQVVRRIASLAQARPWVATGGGGYSLNVVPRAWASAYYLMLGREPPEPLPEEARSRCRCSSLWDSSAGDPNPLSRSEAREFARESVAEVKRLVFPHHGLPAG